MVAFNLVLFLFTKQAAPGPLRRPKPRPQENLVYTDPYYEAPDFQETRRVEEAFDRISGKNDSNNNYNG